MKAKNGVVTVFFLQGILISFIFANLSFFLYFWTKLFKNFGSGLCVLGWGWGICGWYMWGYIDVHVHAITEAFCCCLFLSGRALFEWDFKTI